MVAMMQQHKGLTICMLQRHVHNTSHSHENKTRMIRRATTAIRALVSSNASQTLAHWLSGPAVAVASPGARLLLLAGSQLREAGSA